MPNCHKCSRDPEHAGTWCENHWQELVDRLRGLVSKNVLPLAARVYIGRTHHPERRLFEHRAKKELTHMTVLYWAASWEEAEGLETAMISQFKHLNRVENETDESLGGFGSAWNAVYIAFTLKEGAKRRMGDTTTLRLRERLWPTDRLVNPVWLRCSMSPQDAGAELERHQEVFSRRSATRTRGTGKR